MFPDVLQGRSWRGYRCGLLPPLLLLLLARQLPVADAQQCSISNQQAITDECGGPSKGVCCYPMENTPPGNCARDCKSSWDAKHPSCGSGCSTSDAVPGIMPNLGQVCCLPSPDVDDDTDPGEHNVIVYPAAAVGVLFLLVSCYCYLRSPRRQSSAMESRADQLLRTAFLRGQDKTLMSRKADRSVWERHWSTPMKGEGGGGGGGDDGGTDDDYEEGQYVWRRRGGGGHNRGSEHGSIDSVGSAVLEGIPLSGDPDFDELDGSGGGGGGPRSPSRGSNGSFVVTPPPRRRGQGLRKQGWVRHFIDKASGKSGGTPKGGGIPRGKHDPAAAFRNVKLEWRPAMDPAPSADPVNPAPSRALRQELSDIESRPFSEKVQWFYGKCRDLSVSWDEGHVEIRCRRNALLEDSIAQFKRLNREDWRKIFRFSFVGEPALDAGGVSREWFETVSEAMFCMEERGLFCPSDDSGTMLQIAPPLEDPAEENEKLALLTFCGELMGKAVFDRRIIHAPLILPLFKHVVAAPITLRDLQSVDAEVYRSLLKVRALPACLLARSLAACSLACCLLSDAPVAPAPEVVAATSPLALTFAYSRCCSPRHVYRPALLVACCSLLAARCLLLVLAARCLLLSCSRWTRRTCPPCASTSP
jgi:hypothetical protein